MQAHTLYNLFAYLFHDSNSVSPLDLMTPMHLMMNATVRIDSDLDTCEGYPSWISFTGQISQNVAGVTHVSLFSSLIDIFEIFSLKFTLNETQKNFANIIPYLKKDKIIEIINKHKGQS